MGAGAAGAAGATAADAAAAAAAALEKGGNGGGAGGADDAAAKAASDKAASDKAAADKVAADAAAAGETPEQKAAREKAVADKAAADAAAAAAKAVPDKYDLKLPDKSTVDKAVVERTAAIARELGLSQEHAQKMLDFQVQELASSVDATLKAHAPGGAVWEKQVEDWNAAALADPEVGANKPEQLEASVKLANQVVAKFGDKDSIEFLKTNPLGSHPALVRLLVRIGKASSEGSLVIAGAQDGIQKEAKDIMYPKEKQTVAGSPD